MIDLGADVPSDKFVETVQNEGCQIVALSALLTTTMGVMGDVIKALTDAGLRDKVTVMIGGAPVNEAFKVQVGADIYTGNAADAAAAAEEVLRKANA